MKKSPPSNEKFRTAEVARILGTSPAGVRAMVRAGLCQPARRGRAMEFSFQDLVLLRAANGLLGSDVSPRRVRSALRELARQLPPHRPLSGVRFFEDGGHVVVRDGRAAWQPDTGQAVFIFDADDLTRRARVVVQATKRRRAPARVSSDSTTVAAAWFDKAVALEEQDPASASSAYQRVLDLDPGNSDAYINLGRLAHAQGSRAEAIHCYRQALRFAPDDPVAHYNLALALEDEGDDGDAKLHYHHALELDPKFADAHFNLGRLLDRLGQRRQALRHLLAYKKLTDAG